MGISPSSLFDGVLNVPVLVSAQGETPDISAVNWQASYGLREGPREVGSPQITCVPVLLSQEGK